MSAPGFISIGAGVSTLKRSTSGVMRSRFAASAKNGNTLSRESGNHCQVVSV